MRKVLQLKTAEEDVIQTITWLSEVTDSIQHQHYALGTNPTETEELRQQHEAIKVTKQYTVNSIIFFFIFPVYCFA